jgi:hypothetical protein
MRGEKKKNAAIPRGVDGEAKVLAGMRWAHESQPESLGGLCSCISCWKKDARALVESLADAYAQSIGQKRAENAPLS